jgi:hypothetical protein
MIDHGLHMKEPANLSSTVVVYVLSQHGPLFMIILAAEICYFNCVQKRAFQGECWSVARS